MDGGARDHRCRSRRRCSPFNHPPNPPPTVGGGGKTQQQQQQKSDYEKKQNSDSGGMLTSHASNKFNTRYGFDICRPKQNGRGVVLNPSLFVKNRERSVAAGKAFSEVNGVILRSGMVLLKGYIPITDQVKIVNRCRDLGLGCGGSYQPKKPYLKMMCLGKNFDRQTHQYTFHGRFNGAKPHHIPPFFHDLVKKAMRDSHALIRQHSQNSDPELTLPSFSPDICLVNFYSPNGKLGLHQDKAESEESLRQGLPVYLSPLETLQIFCMRVNKAKKVVLESGDVLIFGGTSRNIFHGVTAIHPITAPNLLPQATNLRQGRLNITFRQY